MSFTFGEHSRRNLQGVHPDLLSVAQKAIEMTAIDFAVLEGLRSADRQAELVASGASQTHQSKHLLGHAIDVGAWVRDGISWEWQWYPQIAAAFRLASMELEVPVVWGAVWDRKLASLRETLALEIDEYRARRGGKAFIDGGHFELRLDPCLEIA